MVFYYLLGRNLQKFALRVYSDRRVLKDNMKLDSFYSKMLHL